MKKLFGYVALFLLFILAICAPSPVLAADVNNFTIPTYQIDYTLSRDAEGRSNLQTVEKIVALFPDYDQNHGIERAIPNTYDGHPTSLSIRSVTDDTGKVRPYTTYESNDNLVLRIGDADSYVHGMQHYVISYSQRDVTRYFADTKRDEFYWDTNGTEWAVPIASLSVNLVMKDGLDSQQTNEHQCYRGAAGATTSCALTPQTNGYSLRAEGLAPGENATIAVGFKPQTFAAYKQSLFEVLVIAWMILLFVTGFIAFVLTVWFIIRYNRKSNRTAEVRSIVPEYTPPKDTSIATSAAIYHQARAVFGAQLIDLAVRKYLTIYETRKKSFWRQADYELEITKDISDLSAEEQELLRDIFPTTTAGTRIALSSLKRDSSATATKLSDNPEKLSKSIRGAYGLRAKDPKQTDWFKRAGILCLIFSIITLSPFLLTSAIVAFVCAHLLWPLTDKGLELYHYLEGLKMYIKVAETERIRMLQGADTAQKIGAQVDTDDSSQMIKLYEEVLPYAMLFGQEKTWNSRLGQYYESLGQSPGWLVSSANSSAAFNAAAFTSTLSSFNTTATYSAPSSSTSGGSGGGGSSGGGGGGGGGGGW